MQWQAEASEIARHARSGGGRKCREKSIVLFFADLEPLIQGLAGKAEQ